VISTKTIEAGKIFHVIFQGLRVNNYKPILLYTPNAAFKIDGEIKHL
jgi:hypothetical protein